jgi:hypothetical protein
MSAMCQNLTSSAKYRQRFFALSGPLRLDLLSPDLMDAESDAGELVSMSLVLDLHSCLIRLGRC